MVLIVEPKCPSLFVVKAPVGTTNPYPPFDIQCMLEPSHTEGHAPHMAKLPWGEIQVYWGLIYDDIVDDPEPTREELLASKLEKNLDLLTQQLEDLQATYGDRVLEMKDTNGYLIVTPILTALVYGNAALLNDNK